MKLRKKWFISCLYLAASLAAAVHAQAQLQYNWTDYAGEVGVAGTANGTGSAAQFLYPYGVAVDGSGNVYVADEGNNTIREIAPGGVVTTIAGTPGVSGTADGTGSSAQFLRPYSVAVDGSGNVYVADTGNNTIREIAPGGVVTTIAGTPGVSGTANGTGSGALFSSPGGVAVDGSNNVYVADSGNNTIREIAPGGGVTTLAGRPLASGTANGTGGLARFNGPQGLTVDGSANVYVADYLNYTIRKIAPGGVVTTLAGDPTVSGTADGAGGVARFYYPQGITVDGSGNVYVADSTNFTIREITPGGVVSTIGGTPYFNGPNLGVGPVAEFAYPSGIAVSGSGLLYVADGNNQRVVLGTYSPFTVAPTLTSPAAGSIALAPVTVSITLPGIALAGSIRLTFDDGGGTLRVLTLSDAPVTYGSPYTFDFDPADPIGSSGGAIAGISGDTMIPLGTYKVTLSYQDAVGHPPASTSATNVRISPLVTPSPADGYGGFVNSSLGEPIGFISDNYVTSASNIYLETGTDTSYGTLPPLNSTTYGYVGPVNGLDYFFLATNLARDTTYHYQFVATIDGTTYYGGDQTFTTTHDDPPTANPDSYYEPSKLAGPITLNVIANDTSGNPFDALTINSFTIPTNGKLQVTGTGTELLYTPSSRYPGKDSFTYTISDGFGGMSTTTVQLYNPYVQFAGNYQGVLTSNPVGYLTVTLGAEGGFTGSLKALGGSYSFKGSLDDTGNAVVTVSGAKLPALTLHLTLDPTGAGGFNFTWNFTGASPLFNQFTEKVLFSSSNPAPETGRYTIIVPPPAIGGTSQATASATVVGGKINSIAVTATGAGYVTTPVVTITDSTGKAAAAHAVIDNSGDVTGIVVSKSGSGYSNSVTVTLAPPSGLPQGTGWGIMTVGSSGAVGITGKLGDGTTFTAGSWIDENYSGYYNSNAFFTHTFPVYANVYSAPAGYILGSFTFEDEAGISDFDGSLSWHKPQQTTPQLYNGGFDIPLTAVGSIYIEPVHDYLLDLQPIIGNALLSASGGNLASQVQDTITILPAPHTGAIFVSGSSHSVHMTTVPSTGAFVGKFTPKTPGPATSFSGVVFQKQNLGSGVFTGSSQSGSVQITPR